VIHLDFLAYVATFPEIDTKIWTDDLQIGIGGNVLNGFCSISIFGIKSRFVTAIGNDSNSQLILGLCKTLSIDTNFITIFDAKTPFSYIIVDKSTQTRTIIHTPGQMLTPTHMNPEMFQGATLLYFKGENRYIHALVLMVDWAEKMGIPIVLDIETYSTNNPELYEKLLKKSTALILNSTCAMNITKKK